MAKKGAMPTYKTIDEYIQNQPEKNRGKLSELRALINEAAPTAIELKDAKVPSFDLSEGKKPGQHIMVAAYAKFISFYPFPAAISHFSEELKGFELGKGAVKFPYDKTLPSDLIKRIVKFRMEEIQQNI